MELMEGEKCTMVARLLECLPWEYGCDVIEIGVTWYYDHNIILKP
jgi:protein-L-isoaspartate O-methyltransferase